MTELEKKYKETLEYIVAWLGPNPTSHMREKGFDCEGCLWEIEETFEAAKGALEGKFWEDRWIPVPEEETKGIKLTFEGKEEFESHQKGKHNAS